MHRNSFDINSADGMIAYSVSVGKTEAVRNEMQGRVRQDRAGKDREGQGRPERTRAGQRKAERGRAERGRTGQRGAGQGKEK